MSMTLMTSKVAQETITGSAWTVPFRGAFNRPLYSFEGMLGNQDKVVAGKSKVCMGVQLVS